MTPRELEEYKALRGTIRERGTTRVWIVLVGFLGWAAALLATPALAAVPAATLVPLLFLAVTFEIVFSLHTGVERIGRYIQVFFEDEGTGEGWERRITAVSARGRSASSDPLFADYFRIAAILNFMPVLLVGPARIEWIVIGTLHLLFIARLVVRRRQAARQHAVDLERFQELRRSQR